MSPLCRWLTPNGDVRHGGQWGVPEKILELEGINSIAAGAHSSAVISDEGELYLWGKLLNKVSLCPIATSGWCKPQLRDMLNEEMTKPETLQILEYSRRISSELFGAKSELMAFAG